MYGIVRAYRKKRRKASSAGLTPLMSERYMVFEVDMTSKKREMTEDGKTDFAPGFAFLGSSRLPLRLLRCRS